MRLLHIKCISEMRAVEELQKEVWGCSDRDVVPVLSLIPAVEVGGVLVGAFDGDRLVGFAYGFVGREGSRMILHSDMLAVKPEYRGRELGYELKLAQRERAMARGIETMTWTFDPLQSRNAHLNFHKLGVVSDSYRINYYGEETSSPLHKNIGTDRLWVRWPLDSERVRRRLGGEGATGHAPPTVDGATMFVWSRADGSPQLSVPDNSEPHEHALIEIPCDIGALRERNLALALAWREATRRAFIAALAAGYLVKEFYRQTGDRRRHSAYRLSRSEHARSYT
jgi:predicted GNAT superfamily acetyltransferase